VDVDAGQRMRDLGDDPRQQRRAEPVKLMREAVAHDRGDARKAEDNFVDAFRRWIVCERGADVFVEGGADLRQSSGERARDLSRRSRVRIGPIARVLLLERKRQSDLLLERRQSYRKRPSHKSIGVSRVQSRRPEVAGVERGNKVPDKVASRDGRRGATPR
jgi:hypothetical protein